MPTARPRRDRAVTTCPHSAATGSGANRLQTDNYTFRARINLTTDFRTQSDYGTIRAYAAIIGQQSQGDASGNGSAGILRAFIQFAGFTVGHAVSYYDFMNGADYGYAPSVWSPSTGVNGTDLIAYTWQIGNGFSASIDIEDGGNGVGGGGGTGRGKVLFNASNGSTLSTVGNAAGAWWRNRHELMPPARCSPTSPPTSASIRRGARRRSWPRCTTRPGATTRTSRGSRLR